MLNWQISAARKQVFFIFRSFGISYYKSMNVYLTCSTCKNVSRMQIVFTFDIYTWYLNNGELNRIRERKRVKKCWQVFNFVYFIDWDLFLLAKIFIKLLVIPYRRPLLYLSEMKRNILHKHILNSRTWSVIKLDNVL